MIVKISLTFSLHFNNNGPLIFTLQVEIMKENLLVILFLSIQCSPSTSLSGLSILNSASNKVGYLNSGLGMISRSKNVNAASQMLRGEDDAAVRESLAQAVTTLAVLDIGGGALVPVTQHIIDTITTDSAFKATRDAWGVYREGLEETFKQNFKRLPESAVKRLLTNKKNQVLNAFETDLGKVHNIPKYSKTMKYINRAKRWFRAKTAAKVLGPLFDCIGIGVNSWALHTAIRDCNDNPRTCNKGAIASASLGIVSGVVGVGVFVATLVVSSSVSAVLGPVGALVSFTLAICATLIELFYKPPVDEEEIRRRKTFQMIQVLESYSRRQLHSANNFMAYNKITRGDLYVVNQGQLPLWIDKNDKLKFGKSESENPREIVYYRGTCESGYNWRVHRYGGFAPTNGGGDPRRCPLLVDGKNIEAGDVANDDDDDVGYGFYGFTTNARNLKRYELLQPDQDYSGAIILVNTDAVQSSELKKEDLDEPLRGIEIDTAKKGNYEAYDDVVALGNMKNLDSSAKVTIRTGLGNDVLNIDGFVGQGTNQLDADLGPGFNTLSFLGMSENDPDITGIIYYAKNGKVKIYHNGFRQNDVGFVKLVSVLGASPFNLDVIYLFADEKAENGEDFTVVKFKGKAKYRIRMSQVAPMSNRRKKLHPFIPHFKIIDTTDNGNEGENKCENHHPLLKVYELHDSTVANDILYNGTHIKIYGKGRDQWLRDAQDPLDGQKASPPIRKCYGEPDGSHPIGGRDGKRLLLTVSFHTKCPGKVEAENEFGACVTKPRLVSELDSVFFDGENIFSNFRGDIQSSQPRLSKADVCTLRCPPQQVTSPSTINLGRGTNYLVIKNDLFLDPCGIDGEDSDMILKRKDGETWELEFTGEHDKFTGNGKKHQLKGVKWIVNEYGHKIVDLEEVREDVINLFDEYTRKTALDIGNQVRREQTDEVADTLTECLQSQTAQGLANICKTD